MTSRNSQNTQAAVKPATTLHIKKVQPARSKEGAQLNKPVVGITCIPTGNPPDKD